VSEQAMLKEQADRVIVFAAADFTGTISSRRNVSAAAEAVEPGWGQPVYGFNPAGGHLFRDTTSHRLLVIEMNRVAAQFLDFKTWQANTSSCGALFKTAIEKLGDPPVKRVGFKVWAFLSTDLRHAEMVELMCGSFLVSAEEIYETAGKLEDVLLQLYTESNGLKAITSIAPQTAEQATKQLLATNNLELFLEEKLLDTTVQKLRDRVGHDCLMIDLDVYQNDVSAATVPIFFHNATIEADRIVTACVGKLKNLRKKGK
jgi:hypothetical protein